MSYPPLMTWTTCVYCDGATTDRVCTECRQANLAAKPPRKPTRKGT